jgi:hypothetical protein
MVQRLEKVLFEYRVYLERQVDLLVCF